MSAPYRFTEVRTSAQSLDWEHRPALGVDRHAGRAKAWQRLLLTIAGLWCGVFGVLITLLIR